MTTGSTQVVLQSDMLLEAPNWHPDGWFLVNAEGRLWRAETSGLTSVHTGFDERCNNDHGFLPDGRIVFCAHNGSGAGMHILDGQAVTSVDLPRPSWWHAAYGDLLTYACVRGHDRVVRIATFNVNTGIESVLTPDPAHHDGPDFSACGQFIWYNSDATGHAQIWRIDRDGSNAAPVFQDNNVNWFPHPSPCGRHVIYLAYPQGTEGHPRDLDVSIRAMSPDGMNRRTLIELFGGQGTMNVPCWSPDGQAFAFMRFNAR
jgi:Tol biopolymer transport system component